jgi:hypothetical protein
MKNLLLLFTLIFLIGCKKDRGQHFDSKVEFVVDSLLYKKDYGADMYYKLVVPNSQSIYKYKWISPSENVDTGPFYNLLMDSYVFSVAIFDSENNFDTIKYYYDYRDKLIGNYKCTVKHVYTYNLEGYISIDTLSVLKSGSSRILIFEDTVKLDSYWSARTANFPGYTTFIVKFIPGNDSINFDIESKYSNTISTSYKGKKIN